MNYQSDQDHAIPVNARKGRRRIGLEIARRLGLFEVVEPLEEPYDLALGHEARSGTLALEIDRREQLQLHDGTAAELEAEMAEGTGVAVAVSQAAGATAAAAVTAEEASMEKAATKVQAVTRGASTRKTWAQQKRAAARVQAAVRGSPRARRQLSAEREASSSSYFQAGSAHDAVVLGSGILEDNFPDAPSPTSHRRPKIHLGQILSSGATMRNVFGSASHSIVPRATNSRIPISKEKADQLLQATQAEPTAHATEPCTGPTVAVAAKVVAQPSITSASSSDLQSEKRDHQTAPAVQVTSASLDQPLFHRAARPPSWQPKEQRYQQLVDDPFPPPSPGTAVLQTFAHYLAPLTPPEKRACASGVRKGFVLLSVLATCLLLWLWLCRLQVGGANSAVNTTTATDWASSSPLGGIWLGESVQAGAAEATSSAAEAAAVVVLPSAQPPLLSLLPPPASPPPQLLPPPASPLPLPLPLPLPPPRQPPPPTPPPPTPPLVSPPSLSMESRNWQFMGGTAAMVCIVLLLLPLLPQLLSSRCSRTRWRAERGGWLPEWVERSVGARLASFCSPLPNKLDGLTQNAQKGGGDTIIPPAAAPAFASPPRFAAGDRLSAHAARTPPPRATWGAEARLHQPKRVASATGCTTLALDQQTELSSSYDTAGVAGAAPHACSSECQQAHAAMISQQGELRKLEAQLGVLAARHASLERCVGRAGRGGVVIRADISPSPSPSADISPSLPSS